MATPKVPYEGKDWDRFHPAAVKSNDDRSQGEVDRSRIIHSAAFRRLQAKTQIFGPSQDSFYRTRLTHSLEVAQIAKGIAVRVGADPDTCEAIALAHDIGHPPFGHKGEDVLGELMSDFGGFEANAQNLRIVGRLEIKSQEYEGLNLSRIVLDGLMKYRKPHPGDGRKFYYVDDPAIKELAEWAMEGQESKTFECSVMDWADDIAYSVHDLEDGLHAGLITGRQVIRLWDDILQHAKARTPECNEDDMTYALNEVIRTEKPGDYRHADGKQGQNDYRREAALRKELTSHLINEFMQVSQIEREAPSSSVRQRFSIFIDPVLKRRCEILKSLSYCLLISDHRVASMEARARHLLTSLFYFYAGIDRNDPGESNARLINDALTTYPEPFRTEFRKADGKEERARVACDFIAGMTDEYAERVFARLFTGERVALGDY